jgi:hypothetical protein
MRVATHLDHVAFPMLVPGITATTSPTDYFPIMRRGVPLYSKRGASSCP